MPKFRFEKRQFTALGVHIFAGGFTVGVKAVGFKVLGHLEDTKYGVNTARANWPDLDVRVGRENWREDDFAGKVDFLYSNPPCAIFSVCGVSTTRGRDAWRTDSRLGCWHRAFEVFAAVRPRVFALESVCQAYTKGREVMDQFTRDALSLGYSVQHVLEDAQWMGVPQSRKRFFFVAHDPRLSLEFMVNFDVKPTTVSEAFAGVDQRPARWRKKRRFDDMYAKCMKIMKGGDRLKDAYDLVFPDPEKNRRGQAVGRPGFMVHRLRSDVPMGVFVGDICIHPTQHRLLNDAEMRAICTYPQDFVLAGSPDGWGSQLARAVMPNVGRWLATAVKESLLSDDQNDHGLRVVMTDLRKHPGHVQNVTDQYLEGDQPSREFVVYPVKATVEKVQLKPVIRTVKTVVHNGNRQPLPGEGSGQFVRRLWMAGLNDPDELVRLVHENWSGRKTKVCDVYYNYRKLLTERSDVPPWPGGRASKTVETTPSVVKEATTAIGKTSSKPTMLLTGSTPMQVGSDRTQLKIVTAAACWASAFREMGYDVDWRAVTPGEDLSSYGCVCVVLNQPCSISSSHVFGAIWSLRERPDAVMFLDDWQVGQLVTGFQTCARSRERTFRLTKYWNKAKMSPVHENKDVLFNAVMTLAAGDWRWPVVVPTLGDGDVSLLGVPGKVVGVDPTSFALRYNCPEDCVKSRRWVQASLTNKPLPKLGWDVLGYGMLDRSQGVGGIGSAGQLAQPRLPESSLMNVYAENWGVLSPAHPHAGSGWWRVRYLMAADAGCVLSADPKEAACLGDPYMKASSVSYVESLSDGGLSKLADSQLRRLRSITWSKDRVASTLESVLSSVSL